MLKVTRYQDLLNSDHDALVAECRRIDLCLHLKVDPYADTQVMTGIKPGDFNRPAPAVKFGTIAWYDNPYAVVTRSPPLPPGAGILGALGSLDPTAALIRVHYGQEIF